MRKIFFFAMIMLTACLSLSCSKSSDHETENASYYVKYESKNTTRYSGDVSQVTVNTDNLIIFINHTPFDNNIISIPFFQAFFW